MIFISGSMSPYLSLSPFFAFFLGKSAVFASIYLLAACVCYHPLSPLLLLWAWSVLNCPLICINGLLWKKHKPGGERKEGKKSRSGFENGEKDTLRAQPRYRKLPGRMYSTYISTKGARNTLHVYCAKITLYFGNNYCL